MSPLTFCHRCDELEPTRQIIFRGKGRLMLRGTRSPHQDNARRTGPRLHVNLTLKLTAHTVPTRYLTAPVTVSRSSTRTTFTVCRKDGRTYGSQGIGWRSPFPVETHLISRVQMECRTGSQGRNSLNPSY